MAEHNRIRYETSDVNIKKEIIDDVHRLVNEHRNKIGLPDWEFELDAKEIKRRVNKKNKKLKVFTENLKNGKRAAEKLRAKATSASG